eukprot:scaffold157511_cov19-Tisochrysis_lutea.AAC.1
MGAARLCSGVVQCPIALAEIPAARRRFPALKQAQLLQLLMHALDGVHLVSSPKAKHGCTLLKLAVNSELVCVCVYFEPPKIEVHMSILLAIIIINTNITDDSQGDERRLHMPAIKKSGALYPVTFRPPDHEQANVAGFSSPEDGFEPQAGRFVLPIPALKLFGQHKGTLQWSHFVGVSCDDQAYFSYLPLDFAESRQEGATRLEDWILDYVANPSLRRRYVKRLQAHAATQFSYDDHTIHHDMVGLGWMELAGQQEAAPGKGDNDGIYKCVKQICCNNEEKQNSSRSL